MGNKPLVSVIIPVYNAEKYIAKTIESVLRQSYRNLEILIIDNKSTDDSIKIVQFYVKNDVRIHHILCEVNSGNPSIPRNIGIDQSNGKYIAFLDSDDLWEDSKLEIQIENMEKNKCLFSYHSYSKIDKYDNIIGEYNIKNKKGYILGDLLKWYDIGILTVVINKEILQFVEKPYFNPCLDYTEDHDLFMRLLTYTEAHPLLDSLAKYRIHNESLSITATDIQWKNMLFTYLHLKKNQKLYKKYKNEFHHFYTLIRKTKADSLIRNSKIQRVRYYLKKCQDLGPRHKKRYLMSLESNGLELLRNELKDIRK